ncbi:MAG: endonuclease domain-containing protein [Saprospiraceae bacterium]|nr:endonuclease domain-containing protein [Saprospiraceae bacterium]
MRKMKGGMHQDASPQLFEKAKLLRYQKMTRHELILWEHINRKQILGQRFRRQHPISNYILDFFSLSYRLCIEVDGKSHMDEINIERDKIRTEYLISNGIKVLRFTNEEIENQIDKVVEQINLNLLNLMHAGAQ